MKKQEKKEKRPKSFRAIAVRIIALALCMWLGFNFLLTWNMEKEIFLQVQSQVYEWVNYENHDLGSTDPGEMERDMISSVANPFFNIKINELQWKPFPCSLKPEADRDNWPIRVELVDYEYAMSYYDLHNDILIDSGNYMTFEYTDAAGWDAAKLQKQGYAWIDLDALPGASEMDGLYAAVIRLTGWFEGNQFHPVTWDRFWSDDTRINNPPFYTTTQERCNELDRKGLLDWENLLTVPAEQGRELITIYGWEERCYSDYEPEPVTMGGKEYESLNALRLAMTEPGVVSAFAARGLEESIISTGNCFDDENGRYVYYLTVRFKPLQEAMQRLKPVYWISGILTLLAVIMILAQIWVNLTEPLKILTQRVESGEKIYSNEAWTEPYALQNWCKDTRQALLEAQAEITRLNTALDYARDAEEYRKQLISNITHELKTPLAVVHSYTEGLQSEIAPEKKERYLQVILDEAERMDGMVMQMLELSRLEAGRVKLKMEHFDLGAVIRDVAERFEPLMAEKELKLRLELDGKEQMNGDEGRMEQVITNFMSNAVKYSTPGGEILVKAIFGKLGLYFSITNNAKHLSEEGLQKVFDSFYREDAARTEKSTGLGLAIVKNIINLHGFQCYVNNTTLNDQPAVEFGFRRE